MDSASGLLNNLATDCELLNEGEDVDVKRELPGVFRKGRHVRSNKFEEFEARGSVQPLTGKEIAQVEEGDRRRRHLWFYTVARIKEDDIITRMDDEYEVQVVEDWGAYTKSRMVLIDVERN